VEKAKRRRKPSSAQVAVAALSLLGSLGCMGVGSSDGSEGDASPSGSADAGSADSSRRGWDAGGAGFDVGGMVRDAGRVGFDGGALLDSGAGAEGSIDAGPSADAGAADAGRPSRPDAGEADGAVAADAGAWPVPAGHFQMEDLDRGAVAVKAAKGIYLGWRMLGYEYSTDKVVSYNVYRDGARIASVADSANYLDPAGSTQSVYAVSAVVNGVEHARSSPVAVSGQNYLRIPLKLPPAGTTKSSCPNANEAYTYSANDGSAGDLDGDGEYEIVLKWDPSNSKDNSKSGCTGNVYLDAYKLGGEHLWRIDLGVNIRAGAHYTQFVVYDFDGDGKAEVAVKTAPGTRDGTGAFLHTGPASSDDDGADYRDASGYVLSGPEYLTVFSGPTGAELATANFDVPRGSVSAWGDSYGNRVDRFLASAAFVSDLGQGKRASGRPSILMARGYYTRATVTAWNWRDGKLTEIWKADSDKGSAYSGQGAHTMAVADVDGDGAQEIIYGASVINSDGTGRCSTALGHGDALHVGDLVPSRRGLEVFMPHEDTSKPSWDVHDASTCEVIRKGPVTGDDTGRGAADDIFAGNEGAEVWALDALFSATSGASVGSKPASVNFLVWWDADELRELEDSVSVTKYGGGKLLDCSACSSNNGTKSTPVLTADLLGDWREEVVWRESDDAALRIYTTTDVTARRIYTLMHDPQYRMQVSSEQTAYNQPPHPSFAIGHGMAAPPAPDIHLAGGSPAAR
jgi:rhamnogalacturonan endolyase